MADEPVGRQVRSLALAALVGGLVSFGFQAVSDSQKRASERRESQRTAATQLFQEIGRLMDARYYHLANGAAASPAEAARWQAAVDSLGDLWHERIPTDVALMCHYFGDSLATQLLSVSRGFSAMELAPQNAEARAAAAESVRTRIFSLELELADRLRQEEIIDRDLPTAGCPRLDPARERTRSHA